MLNESEASADDFYITGNPNNLHQQINAVCKAADLPQVGCHGLRRSFASLAYFLGIPERELMREGGWADFETMHKKYVKLAEADLTEDDAISQFFESL